jgi:hypothetical protein
MGGDDLEPYLVLGAGEGTRPTTSSRTIQRDRHVALIEGNRLVVVDAITRRRTVLEDGDTAPGDTAYGPHRGAAFAADGSEPGRQSRIDILGAVLSTHIQFAPPNTRDIEP